MVKQSSVFPHRIIVSHTGQIVCNTESATRLIKRFAARLPLRRHDGGIVKTYIEQVLHDFVGRMSANNNTLVKIEVLEQKRFRAFSSSLIASENPQVRAAGPAHPRHSEAQPQQYDAVIQRSHPQP